MQLRLASWKGKLLNKAGRACLARTVTTAIPTYLMQTHYIPRGVCDQLNKITRSFVWGGDGVSRGWSLVNWNTITSPKRFGGLGIRDAEINNIALLGKLIWSILHEPQKLWVRILRHKYLGNKSIWSVKATNGSSLTWRAIINALEELKDGFRFRIGAGTSSLWFTDWMGSGPICNMVDYVHITDSNLMLRDICVAGTWILDQLYTPMNEEIITAIRNHPPPAWLNDRVDDTWIWSTANNGKYTCASAYHWLLERNRSWDPGANWCWVWRIGVPAKIQHLVWLCLHDALPTNKKRHRCNLSTSDKCSRCSGPVEDALHCLRDCPHSRELWMRIGLLSHPRFLTHTEVVGWVSDMARSDVSIRFVTTLWWAWVWRNQMIFNENPPNIHNIVRSTLASHDENIKFYPGKAGVNPVDRMLAHWQPPEEGKFKLNTDGSAKPDSSAIGSGGLLRNHKGEWIGGFISNDGIGEPLLAELYGIFHGLSIVRDLGFVDVVCETDCLEAVELLQNIDNHKFHPQATILAAIVQLLEGGHQFSIVHSVRETNMCADFLAKKGVSSSARRLWLSRPPAGLGALLLSDSLSL